mmetsp:Transcript_18529/g.55088  ORF Transcript_18529/g.55088 Transcript_18529/m.55088 type:complete len:193 (+) Transcript_18529:172-750(+)
MGANNPPKAQPEAPELSPKMFVVPALMLGTKYFKLDFSAYVFELRIGFGCAVLLSVLAYFACSRIAASKKEAGEVVVKEKNLKGETETKTYTVAAYDSAEALKKIRAAVVQVAMISAIHYKWGSPMPLLFQCVMQPMNLLDEPLVKIHLLGHEAKGKLARPWKPPPNPLEQLLKPDGDDDEKAVAKPDKKKD